MQSHWINILVLLLVPIPLGLFLFIFWSNMQSLRKTGVPYIRSRLAGLDEVIEKIGLSDADEVWDLGSGDGKVLFYLEKKTQAKGVGFELSLWPHMKANLRKRFSGSQLVFKREDFFSQDFSRPTVIYAYLFPALMAELQPQLLLQTGRGLKVIALDFPLPDLDHTDMVKNGRSTYYLYTL